MSLTQVSTWFANARRRLKKENRVTWETPRDAAGSDEHETDEIGTKGELVLTTPCRGVKIKILWKKDIK